MSIQMITCTMCGHRFDPATYSACRACPLQSGCQLICCPVCGFEMVNPDRSVLARLAKRWLTSSNERSGPDPSQKD